MDKRFIVAMMAAALAGCGGDTIGSAQPNPGWTVGFWFWSYGPGFASASVPVDALYLQAGRVFPRRPSDRPPWGVTSSLPAVLPPAREYWLVYRFDVPGVPQQDVIPELSKTIAVDLADARRRKLPVAGVQFDIDSPTAGLAEYGTFLKEFRSALPANTRISITALLDWFRSGTAVAVVLTQVDEFVPQFYDTGDRSGEYSIAVPIDAARYGPEFEKAGKPYRIGAASFGRGRRISAPDADGRTAVVGTRSLGDVSPPDLSMLGIKPTATQTPAGETLLTFQISKSATLGFTRVSPGDRFEFLYPTMASLRAAVAEAKAMGPHCSGILFFRWPNGGEMLAAQPDQVLRAAGVLTTSVALRLIQRDKGCAAVHCTDLFISDAEPLSDKPVRYTVHSSAELEYFIAAEKTPARMAGSDTIELTAPPFLGRSQIYLGRAVTVKAAEYRLEERSR